MEFLLLGPLVVRDGGRDVALPRAKQRAALAVLLLNANEVVSTERLVDALWGERPPKTALDALHNTVSQLRKALGAELVVTRHPGYVLEVEPWRIDAHRFHSLRSEAGRGPPGERAAKLREALALWRGPPLADLAYEPFAQVETVRLEELRVATHEDLVDAELERGRADELVPELETLVAAHPLRERVRAQLILALYRAGRQAEALDAYRTARVALLDALGLEPGPALRELEQAILRQDPSLLRAGEPSRVDPPATRRTVSVVVCDLGLAQSLDPEAREDAASRCFAALRTAFEAHGGTFDGLAGGEAVGVFGATAAHEDDALRAVRATVDARAALARLESSLRRRLGVAVAPRIGIATGTAVSSGAPSVVAAAHALARAADADAVLLDEQSLRLVRHAVVVDEREEGSRLVDVVAGVTAPARALDAPMRGRADDLARLMRLFDEARDERTCRVVAVLGDAGIGKTRIAREFTAAVDGDATVAIGRCVSYGAGATYLPLTEVVETVAGARTHEAIAAVVDGLGGELVAARVADLVGAGVGGGPTGEAHWAVRRFLEAHARTRPLVVVLDDVQWAEPALLDLVDYLAAWSRDVPLLVLCLARPELLDRRRGWAAAPSLVQAVELAPLEATESRALLDALGGSDALDDGVRDRIVSVADGNPLFVEQLVAFAAEGGDPAAVPPSVEALLASRLDRLPPDARAVVELAAVAGRAFTAEALLELSPAAEASEIGAHLAELVRRRLLDGDGPAAFRFNHVLVRDVAYAATTKARRAELHERFAEWLERDDDALDELVGYHLEQAYRLRIELAPADGRARRLASAAGERLADAGLNAWRRADARAAANLLERATSILPSTDPRRRELLCELALVLRTTAAAEDADRLLERVVAEAAAAGDRRSELRAKIELAGLRLFRDCDDGAADAVADLAAEAVPIFDAVGDHRALGRTWLLVGGGRGAIRCENEAWEEAARRAAFHYRRSGWFPSTCLREIAAALFHGPVPVAVALDRCRALLEDAAADPASEANVQVFVGGLEGLRGSIDEGRRLVDRATAVHEELGHVLVVADLCGWMTGEIAVLGGDLREAERVLRRCCETLEEARQRGPLATHAAELAEVLYAQGRLSDAEPWTRTSERNAAADDISAQAHWRGVRAKIRADEGAFADAEKLAREAVRLAAATDASNRRARVLLDLAHVLESGGRATEARDCIVEAVRLYELKGSTVFAERARRLLAGATPARA